MPFLPLAKKSIALGAGLLSAGLSAGLTASLLGASPAVAAPATDSLIADNHMATGEPMSGEMSANDEMSTGTYTSTGTIVDVASSSDSFTTLVQAVQAADLGATLSGSGPYTVFAPTDEAFAQLPDGALEFLLQPENKDLLKQVLTYHVVSGEVTSDQLSTGGVSGLGGGLAIGVYDSGVVVNNASVTQADIPASNGVIHQVNRVLVPEALQQQLATRLGVSRLYQ